MAASANVYANALDQALQGKINWLTDTIKCALLTSSYTPSTDLATEVHWSDVSTYEASGTGYTAGGVALTSLTHSVTAAQTWGTVAATSTAYTVGQIVRPSTANGFAYRCVVAGTSGASAPSWPTTVGQTVTDGGVTWVNAGSSVSVYTSAAASWASSTITAAYAVIYDAQTGVSTTEPLIALQSFGSSIPSTGGTYQVSPDATLGWFDITPA